MVIGDRLRTLRETKKFSQGDIEKRTGLLRCYISRVENGHTVPSVETLEKMARALEVPMYELFYVGDGPPAKLKLPTPAQQSPLSTKEEALLGQFIRLFAKSKPRDLKIFLQLAQKMAGPRRIERRKPNRAAA